MMRWFRKRRPQVEPEPRPVEQLCGRGGDFHNPPRKPHSPGSRPAKSVLIGRPTKRRHPASAKWDHRNAVHQARSPEDRLQHSGSLPCVQPWSDDALQSHFGWSPSRGSRRWQDDHSSRGAARAHRGGGLSHPQKGETPAGTGASRDSFAGLSPALSTPLAIQAQFLIAAHRVRPIGRDRRRARIRGRCLSWSIIVHCDKA